MKPELACILGTDRQGQKPTLERPLCAMATLCDATPGRAGWRDVAHRPPWRLNTKPNTCRSCGLLRNSIRSLSLGSVCVGSGLCWFCSVLVLLSIWSGIWFVLDLLCVGSGLDLVWIWSVLDLVCVGSALCWIWSGPALCWICSVLDLLCVGSGLYWICSVLAHS
jgi:hypothetical protein